MDYIFVPGTTGFENDARAMLDLKPNTEVINTGLAINEVDDYIDEAERRLNAANQKLNALYIGSHANAYGQLFIELDDTTTTDRSNFISYEALEGVNARRSIRINNAVINPRPNDTQGNPVPAFFYIKGCRIGRSVPFLNLLKIALGGNVNVNAPKHIHYITPFNGFIESFSYSFLVFSRNKIPSLNRIRTAFRNHLPRFTFYDGTNIPNNQWNKWIISANSFRRNVNVRLNPAIALANGNAINNFRMRRARRFINRGRTVICTYSINYGNNAPPANLAQRLQAIRASIQGRNEFQGGHLYPFYVRRGYANFPDFFNGLNWHLSTYIAQRDDPAQGIKKGDKILRARGRRYEYEFRTPITRVRNGNLTQELIFNYYPDPFVQARHIADPLLLENNNQFFQTVPHAP